MYIKSEEWTYYNRSISLHNHSHLATLITISLFICFTSSALWSLVLWVKIISLFYLIIFFMQLQLQESQWISCSFSQQQNEHEQPSNNQQNEYRQFGHEDDYARLLGSLGFKYFIMVQICLHCGLYSKFTLFWNCYLWLILYDETSTIYVMLEFEVKYKFYFFAKCIEWWLIAFNIVGNRLLNSDILDYFICWMCWICWISWMFYTGIKYLKVIQLK